MKRSSEDFIIGQPTVCNELLNDQIIESKLWHVEGMKIKLPGRRETNLKIVFNDLFKVSNYPIFWARAAAWAGVTRSGQADPRSKYFAKNTEKMALIRK